MIKYINCALTGVAILGLATYAAVAKGPTMVEKLPKETPSMVVQTNILDRPENTNLTQEGCVGYAIHVLSELKVKAIDVQLPTVWGVAEFNSYGYTIGIRCAVEHKIVFYTVAGKDQNAAHIVLRQLIDIWQGTDEDEKL